MNRITPFVLATTVGVAAPILLAQPQTSGVSGRLRGISAVSDRVAWASGAGGTVLRTIDGGATWQKLPVPGAEKLDFRDIDAMSDRMAYALSIGPGEASRIYKTTDGGVTWELQLANKDPNVFLDAMAFWDAGRGVAFSDSVDGQFVIFTTADGGRAWTRVPADRLPAALPGEGAFAASGTNVAVHGRGDVWIGTTAARVLHSSDGGKTWTVAVTPLAHSKTAGIFSIAFRDRQHGVVVGGDYQKESEAVENAAWTADGGKTWTLVRERGLSGFRSVVAWAPGGTRGLIAVGPSGADRSSDDGRTWTRDEDVSGGGFDTLSFAPSGGVAWAAGSKGRISKLTWRTSASPGSTARGLDSPGAALWEDAQKRRPLHANVRMIDAYERALTHRRLMPRFSSVAGRVPSLAGVTSEWTSLGPGNIGGRTRVVKYHPLNHAIVFAAGVSGGIWRSDDDGATWRMTSDGLANLAVNTLAIDRRQPDVMYVGTGEGYFREEIRGTGLPLRGSGIFKTRDGGRTWARLAGTATDDFAWVNDIEIGIGDNKYVYAATRSGVWRSDDYGEHWTRLIESKVRGGCLDLAIRPDRSEDTLFASCGSYEQATVYRLVKASEEDGEPEVVLREPGMGRTSLAISPSHPNIMYALAASNDPGPGGNYQQALLAVYRSDGDGAPGTWEPRVTNADTNYLNTLLLSNPAAASIQQCGSPTQRNNYTNMGWYTNVIGVDPRDPDRVWAAGVDWFRSDDGGRTWGLASSQSSAARTTAHVDQHAITFHPDYDGDGNQVAIVGNDGGLYRTFNARGGVSTGERGACSASLASIEVRWESLNRDYGVTQFYHGLPFPDGQSYIGGAQDNSTLFGTDEVGPNAWRTMLGGDGGYVAVHPTDRQIIYAESQWANMGKSVDGGARFVNATRGLDPVRSSTLGPEANYLFIAPFVMDPANANRLWVGGEYLYRTVDGANVWTKASRIMPDGGIVSAIAIAPRDPNHVLAGTNKGDVVSTRTALSTTANTAWTSSRPRDGWITSVAFDPANADTIFATYGNFGGAHVYRSTDGGVTWTGIDGTGRGALPDVPVHSIAIDPDDSNRLYVGTDAGVFVSLDGGAAWMAEDAGFGPAVTMWLVIQRDTSGVKRIWAFTHGRGAWRATLL